MQCHDISGGEYAVQVRLQKVRSWELPLRNSDSCKEVREYAFPHLATKVAACCIQLGVVDVIKAAHQLNTHEVCARVLDNFPIPFLANRRARGRSKAGPWGSLAVPGCSTGGKFHSKKHVGMNKAFYPKSPKRFIHSHVFFRTKLNSPGCLGRLQRGPLEIQSGSLGVHRGTQVLARR